nr:serine/threonine-protein kinase fray2-like isoform X1 [Crassostrea gigas]
MDQATRPGISQVQVEWGPLTDKLDPPLQAPCRIPSLFSANRLVVYGFVKNCTQAILKAKVDEQEFETIVSTTELNFTEGKMLHQLAARAVIRDYEDGVLSASSSPSDTPIYSVTLPVEDLTSDELKSCFKKKKKKKKCLSEKEAEELGFLEKMDIVHTNQKEYKKSLVEQQEGPNVIAEQLNDVGNISGVSITTVLNESNLDNVEFDIDVTQKENEPDEVVETSSLKELNQISKPTIQGSSASKKWGFSLEAALSPTLQTYSSTSPAYNPTSPAYSPTSPAYSPTSPAYNLTSLAFRPTSPILKVSKAFNPTSPAYLSPSIILHPTFPAICLNSISQTYFSTTAAVSQTMTPQSFTGNMDQKADEEYLDDDIHVESDSEDGDFEVDDDRGSSLERRPRPIDKCFDKYENIEENERTANIIKRCGEQEKSYYSEGTGSEKRSRYLQSEDQSFKSRDRSCDRRARSRDRSRVTRSRKRDTNWYSITKSMDSSTKSRNRRDRSHDRSFDRRSRSRDRSWDNITRSRDSSTKSKERSLDSITRSRDSSRDNRYSRDKSWDRSRGNRSRSRDRSFDSIARSRDSSNKRRR